MESLQIDHSRPIAYAEAYLVRDPEKKLFIVYYQGFDPILKVHDWVALPEEWYWEDELEIVKIKYN